MKQVRSCGSTSLVFGFVRCTVLTSRREYIVVFSLTAPSHNHANMIGIYLYDTAVFYSPTYTYSMVCSTSGLDLNILDFDQTLAE
jgi:hypothetical protein